MQKPEEAKAWALASTKRWKSEGVTQEVFKKAYDSLAVEGIEKVLQLWYKKQGDGRKGERATILGALAYPDLMLDPDIHDLLVHIDDRHNIFTPYIKARYGTKVDLHTA